MDYIEAILHIRPEARFNIADNDYSTIEWLDESEQPSEAECAKAWKEIEREYGLRPIRAERDRRLVASDWTQAADAPVDAKAWAAYRQALRDLPATVKDPTQPVDWPTPPE